MKIIQVLAGGKHGGAETAFVDMCIAMHDFGQHVQVITRANDIRVPRLRAAGLIVHILPFGGRFDVYTTMKMRKIIKDFKPDIVQSWMSRASQKVPRWRESMNIPRYVTVARLGGYYKLKYFKPIEYFVTITPDIKTYLEKEGVQETHVRHISNFAEVDPVSKPIDRAQYGVPEGATVLLGLGRLHDSKAFDTLIKATAAVPNTYLWIAGEGPDRASLEALIAQLEVQNRVILLGWRDDRAALFQAVDICVFSSRYEPFGTVFVQSWAQKTPLITTNSDGPRQFVRDEEDGLIVPIDDVPAMSAAIKRVSDDPDLRERLINAGYARYSDEFTKEKSVQAYLKYYASIRARENPP